MKYTKCGTMIIEYCLAFLISKRESVTIQSFFDNV